MPHCGRGLYNNVIWANWGAHCLHRIAIFGNSFALYRSRHTIAATASADSKQSASAEVSYACLDAVSPYTRETPLPSTVLACSSLLASAFNDSSLHTFAAFPDSTTAPLARPPEYNIASASVDPEIIPAAAGTL